MFGLCEEEGSGLRVSMIWKPLGLEAPSCLGSRALGRVSEAPGALERCAFRTEHGLTNILVWWVVAAPTGTQVAWVPVLALPLPMPLWSQETISQVGVITTACQPLL